MTPEQKDALKTKLGDKPRIQIILFAARCARLVYHLMEDERSRKAVDITELYALGLVENKEMKEVRREAAAAAAAAYAAAYAADAAYAAYAAAYAADAAYAAYAAAYAAKSGDGDVIKKIEAIYDDIFNTHQQPIQ